MARVDLPHDPAPGEAADAEGQVEGQRPGGNGLDVHVEVLTHPHDRPLAELLLDLPQGHVECLVTFHVVLLSSAVAHLTVPTLRNGYDTRFGGVPGGPGSDRCRLSEDCDCPTRSL